MRMTSRSVSRFAIYMCSTLAIIANNGCADAPSPSGDKAEIAMNGADLSRAIASAMADEQVRVTVRDAMASSSFARHRIILQSFLQSAPGSLMLTRMAEGIRTSPDELLASLARVQLLEFYLPKRADRVSWSGGDHLAVAATAENGEVPEIAFTPRGDTTSVAQLRTSNQEALPATFILRPARSQMVRTQLSPQTSRTTVQDPAENGLAVSSVTVAGEEQGSSPVFLEACDPTAILCDGGGSGSGPAPPSTYLGVLWQLASNDFGNPSDGLELRFESYWTRISDGFRIDHTELGYDTAPDGNGDFLATVDRVLSPHVVDGVSGYYIHTEVWENDGWWGSDHYGDADLTSTSMYYPHGSSAPGFITGDWRCGYNSPRLGYFLCKTQGGLYDWKEVTFNVWHN